jgi:hypothetical protein
MVLLSLRKLVRFRNFLRTWLPRRLSLVGADIHMRRVSQNPSTREPKKEISWLRLTEPLLRGATFSPSGLLSHVPFLWRQTTFLGLLLFFFLKSPSHGDRPPSLVFFSSPFIFGDRPALAEFNGIHVRDLVSSSSEKKPFASLT